MRHRLDNYLRAHRRRAGLTQDEVAFLLGSASGTKVSRYEQGRRRPPLETAFAYEIIFGAPSRELFAGIYERIERTARRRARLLADRLGKAAMSRVNAHKLAALRALAASVEKKLSENR